jgi:hypothetical protein
MVPPQSKTAITTGKRDESTNCPFEIAAPVTRDRQCAAYGQLVAAWKRNDDGCRHRDRDDDIPLVV